MPGDRMTHKDVLGNQVYSDNTSLGLNLLSEELRYETKRLIKKCMEKPLLIIKLSESNLFYILGYERGTFIAEVVLKDSEWYVQGYNLEHDNVKTVEIIKKNPVIYSEL